MKRAVIKWKQRNGKKISIAKMSDDHIRNAQAMMIGHYVQVMMKRLIPWMYLPEIFYDMNEELEGRKFKKDLDKFNYMEAE